MTEILEYYSAPRNYLQYVLSVIYEMGNKDRVLDCRITTYESLPVGFLLVKRI